DRPGGLGGKDLYKSLKADNGDWGDAINLGPTINTPYDEDGPFIHPDGVTLFFSSNGHQTMGGYDVFYSTLAEDGSTWSDPTNVGYPVNSTDDDIFFVVSPDNKRAYYTSLRAGGYGDKDNYMVSFEENRNAAIALLRGTVLDQNGKALDDVKITVTDNATGKVVGVYNANTKTGKYLFVLRSGKNYNISYEAKDFLFYSYNVDVPKKTNYFEIVKEVQLPRIIVGSVVVLENLFFDYDKASLTAESQTELNNILKFLNENPNLIVQIAGYTDSKGSSKYNKSLSVDRAKSVVAQLVSKGVEKKRLVAKGYGELEPNAPNQKEDGTDNPEGRQLNRRVELKIIEVRKEK
ncbi:MAG TPA: OmpA family protein, partial [Cytophagales bacterium]|nr:OmpA family protein [Cytophagales bacterium]